MNKKILYLSFILALFIMMPFIGSKAALSPESLANNELTTKSVNNDHQLTTKDGIFDFDGTIIEIDTLNSSWVRVTLNQTYIVDIYQMNDYFEAYFSQIISIEPLVYELILYIEVVSFELDLTSVTIQLGTGEIISVSYSSSSTDWIFVINDFTFLWNDEVRFLDIFNTDFHIQIDYSGEYEHILVNYFGAYIDFYRWDKRSWFMNFFSISTVNATYIPPSMGGELNVDYQSPPDPIIPVFTDFPSFGDPEVWHDPGLFLTVAFIESVLIVAHDSYVIAIYEDKVVIDYVFITIIIYMTTIIERIVIMFYEYTVIYYITIVELVIVIIWETIEIKVYHYQIVIIYEIVEIIILLYELYFVITINIHIDIWIIEILFVILICNPIIIQPVIWRFIPIFFPVLIPIYFLVPIYTTQYICIYIPFIAQQTLISVHQEVLQKPTHTIQYFVSDETGAPIIDAMVNVLYNSTDYIATDLGLGIYEVELPASDESEFITVTATKPYYPAGHLQYTLEVNWTAIVVTETTTVEGSLPVIITLTSIFFIAISSLIITKKKRN